MRRRRPGAKESGAPDATRARPARAVVFAASLLLAGAPDLVEACSVCFGNPDSPHTQGMNNAILFLLVVIVAVLVCFAAFFLRLRRMSRLARADHGGSFGGGGFAHGAPSDDAVSTSDPTNGTSRPDRTRF